MYTVGHRSTSLLQTGLREGVELLTVRQDVDANAQTAEGVNRSSLQLGKFCQGKRIDSR